MKKTIFILLTIFFLSPIAVNANACDNTPSLKCAFQVSDSSHDDPLDTVAGGGGYEIVNSAKTGTETIIATIITAALSFLGVIFLILMIYGGFMWMTASGNDEQVKKSVQLITAAIIGLIIVVSAYAISFFVMSKMGGYLN